MAVFKSNLVTDADNKDVQIDAGLVSRDGFLAGFTAAGAIADNDVILMGEVPVDAKIESIIMHSDDLGTTGDLNLGFYPGKGSRVDILAATDAVDEDALATAIDVNAAALANVEVRFEVKNLTTQHQKAWELAGMSERPDYGSFYMAFTASEATTVGGDLALRVKLKQA